MSPNPTQIVLSSMRRHGVRALLMGGQACVFYGAAEFSRDIDLALLADEENLANLAHALEELRATTIAVPPFKAEYLDQGLAIHFRCQAPGVEGFRVDVMSVMRGVDHFDQIWERRTTIEVNGEVVDMLSLPDLVKAKKTQRAKDWPMLQRLLEAHWFQNESEPTPARVEFWLRECITPALLIEIADRFPVQAAQVSKERIAVSAAIAKDQRRVEGVLDEERRAEVAADKEYWAPLKQALEALRRNR